MEEKKQGKRFGFLKWFIGTTIALAAVLTQVDFAPDAPSFVIENPVVRSDGTLIVVAENKAARKSRLLTVAFDDVQFPDAVEPQRHNGRYVWEIALSALGLPESARIDGSHNLRFGFRPDNLSESRSILINSKEVVVEGSLDAADGKNTRRLEGLAATHLQDISEEIAVSLFFFHEDEYQRIEVPTFAREDAETGLIYFEFAFDIKAPSLPSGDPRYAEKFFALKVTDQAGNPYYQQLSYAQFVAPGEMVFSAGTIADITLQRIPGDSNEIYTASFQLAPRSEPRVVDVLPDGRPPIDLTVTVEAKDRRHLTWKENVPIAQELALVFRDGQTIGVSLTGDYLDDDALGTQASSYHVEKTDGDLIYRSDTETVQGEPALVPELDIAAEPTQGKFYRIRRGDNLLRIASRAYGDAPLQYATTIAIKTNELCSGSSEIDCVRSLNRIGAGQIVALPFALEYAEIPRSFLTLEVRHVTTVIPTVAAAHQSNAFSDALLETFPEVTFSQTEDPSTKALGVSIEYYPVASSFAVEVERFAKQFPQLPVTLEPRTWHNARVDELLTVTVQVADLF